MCSSLASLPLSLSHRTGSFLNQTSRLPIDPFKKLFTDSKHYRVQNTKDVEEEETIVEVDEN